MVEGEEGEEVVEEEVVVEVEEEEVVVVVVLLSWCRQLELEDLKLEERLTRVNNEPRFLVMEVRYSSLAKTLYIQPLVPLTLLYLLPCPLSPKL